MRIWIDGSGWNGKESKYIVALENGDIDRHRFDSPFTNNEMEYEALIQALHLSHVGDEILSDSQLVVNQVNGLWKVHEERLFPLCQEAQGLMKKKQCTLTWIPRAQNKAGHLLEK